MQRCLLGEQRFGQVLVGSAVDGQPVGLQFSVVEIDGGGGGAVNVFFANLLAQVMGGIDVQALAELQGAVQGHDFFIISVQLARDLAGGGFSLKGQVVDVRGVGFDGVQVNALWHLEFGNIEFNVGTGFVKLVVVHEVLDAGVHRFAEFFVQVFLGSHLNSIHSS